MDVDTLTYRLFGDVNGKVAGWDIHGDVGVMYASMSQKIFGELLPGAAQTALNNGTYVPRVSTNGQALFAPENSTHPSSTLGVIDLTGQHNLFDMPGGPLTMVVGGQYMHKALNVPFTLATPPGHRTGSLVLPWPNASPAVPDSAMDGARNPLPQVPRKANWSMGVNFAPIFGVVPPP